MYKSLFLEFTSTAYHGCLIAVQLNNHYENY